MFKKKVLWVVGGVILLVIYAAVVMSMQRCAVRSIQGKFGESGESRETKSLALRDWTESRQSVVDIPAVRKLIKKAELNLEVKNCEEVSKKIVNIVNSFSGIVIDSEIRKYPNESKRGRMVLKILPKDFDIVLRKLKELGKVDLERITAGDVTEEYVDLEARLKNFQRVKERLFKILEERAREVKDILKVERELSRLGEQIERIEGRMKYLNRQVELATITVNYYEPKAIAPEPLNIVKRFKETMRTAVEAFINVFNGVIVVIAAILPILIWAVIIILISIAIKRLFIKKS
ncbi:MAG: DUF4349 domain-containing protein [Candidatus Omnitrophica bacterium]|nr:DUF4349 domain-containing protein [Candidatus Omnitrophota bacterium]